MKKLLLAITIFLSLSFIVDSTAYAHVLVTDTTNKKAVILHINPDDDPIAGKSSTLYFDIQDALSRQLKSVQLEITDSNDVVARPTATVNDTLVTADYTFPSQGVYTLTFVVQTENRQYTFKQAQLVSRGTSLVAEQKVRYAWAEPILFDSMLFIAVLALVAFNRRSSIAKQSTF